MNAIEYGARCTECNGRGWNIERPTRLAIVREACGACGGRGGEFPILFTTTEREHHPELTANMRTVPWALVRSCEGQARSNHDQSVQRLAERGGLCLSELAAVLEGRAWRTMTTPDAHAIVSAKVEAYVRSI